MEENIVKAAVFRSHYEAAKCISDRDARLTFLEALLDYQFYGEYSQDLPEIAKVLMVAALPVVNKELEGKQGGRAQKALPPSDEIEAMRSELGSMDAVADALGVDKATIYRHLSKEKQNKECCKTAAKCNVASVANVAVSQKQNVERENDKQAEKQEEREDAQSAPMAAKPPALLDPENLSQNSALFPTEQAAGSPQHATQPQEKQKQQKSAAFSASTVEEVAAYCGERNNGVDAEAFVAFYASKGWMVGKNRMKDWRQAVITWEKRAREQAAGQNQARGSPSGAAASSDRAWNSNRQIF